MLNELLIIEQGLPPSEVEKYLRHNDVKDAGKKPTLRVRLDTEGKVADVDPVPKNLALWTFGKGNKERFPFLQINAPLLYSEDEGVKTILASLNKLRGNKKRDAFLDLFQRTKFDTESFKDWPGIRNKNGKWSLDPKKYIKALKARKEQLKELQDSESKCVIADLNRFFIACEANQSGGTDLLRQVAEQVVKKVESSADDNLLGVSEPLLFTGGGAIFFDVPSNELEFTRLVSDWFHVAGISRCLKKSVKGNGLIGADSLTGEEMELVKDTFPEIVLRPIGRTILFSRFDAIPSNKRYGRFGAESFRAGQDTVDTLAASLKSITSPEREDLTWRSIPGEKPKQNDLLVAFVNGAPEVPLVESLAEEDFSEEENDALLADQRDTIAKFEKRTERLIDLVKAKVGYDITKTPVQFIVLRKVDQANRKVVYSDSLTVANLYEAATNWAKGERNVPSWMTLPIFSKGERQPQQVHPPHVAPLGLIAFSKQAYIRGGTMVQKIVGISASEALILFLGQRQSVKPKAEHVLRLLLARRASLLIGMSHVQHTPQSWARRNETIKKYDGPETLRTVTILGVLLNKLKRTREVYMSDTAFKLGQLLAAADILHAGYCADVRGGSVPPSLLGNQVFTMAQTSPAKALASLCRRWKPYEGWAKRNTDYEVPDRFKGEDGKWKKAAEFKTEKEKKEFHRAMAISKALFYKWKVAEIAEELKNSLPTRCDDIFRAELLLGYVAGFPKAHDEESNTQEINTVKEDQK